MLYLDLSLLRPQCLLKACFGGFHLFGFNYATATESKFTGSLKEGDICTLCKSAS